MSPIFPCLSRSEVYEWAMRLEVPLTHTLAVCCIPIDVPSMAIRVALRQHSHLRGTNALALVDQCTKTKWYYSVLVNIGQDVNEEQGPSSVWFDGPAESSYAVVYPERPIKSEPGSSRTNLEEVDMCASSSSPESYCESTVGAATDHSPPLSIAPAPTSGGNEIQMLVQSLAELGGVRAEASMQQQYRKLKIFSGTKPTPAGEEAYDAWIEYTSQVVEEWTCPELVKRQRIMECLRSPASISIRLAKDQHADITAQKMLETLERAYGRTEDEGQLMMRYLSLRQKLGEELSAYLHRIRNVLWDMQKRDQIKSTQVDEYCWNQFRKGALPDNPIAIMVKCSLMRHDPPCWDDLVYEINKHEAYGRLHTPAKVKEPTTSDPTKAAGAKAKNPATPEEKIATKGSGHKARPARNSPPPYRGRSESRDLLCYTCGKKGHFTLA
ncbi:paraneoplastic antigen Ma2 homolog [Ascaphus truei]|uniref:paraneoplastic antigen Ma2 homolog n=1 Tax=Ascaphus truei TaxID=8439 RepID=UPI003F5A2075